MAINYKKVHPINRVAWYTVVLFVRPWLSDRKIVASVTLQENISTGPVMTLLYSHFPIAVC